MNLNINWGVLYSIWTTWNYEERTLSKFLWSVLVNEGVICRRWEKRCTFSQDGRTIYSPTLGYVVLGQKPETMCFDTVISIKWQSICSWVENGQWLSSVLIGFILFHNCAWPSHLDRAITVWWSGSCVHWIMVNWGLREWTNMGYQTWECRACRHNGADCQAVVCCTSFDPLYCKEIKTIWNKTTLITFNSCL